LELPIFSRKNIKTVSQATLKENLDFSNFGNIFKVAELSFRFYWIFPILGIFLKWRNYLSDFIPIYFEIRIFPIGQ
jgi:hypothetical protein